MGVNLPRCLRCCLGPVVIFLLAVGGASFVAGAPIGNPSAANHWSTTSAVAIVANSGVGPGREATHLIDGSGITGASGNLLVTSSEDGTGANGFATFTDFRSPPPSSTGINASAPNPGTSESSGSAWVEFGFDKIYNLSDVAIWNDNEAVYNQGWKHLEIQVSTTGGTDPAEWQTVYNGDLPDSPGPGDGKTPGHAPGSATLPAAVLSLADVAAKYVVFINTGQGNENSYFSQYNGYSDPYDSVLGEVRFNSGLSAGTSPPPLDLSQPFVTYSGGPQVTETSAQQMLEGGINLIWVNSMTELNEAWVHGQRAMWFGPLDDATIQQIKGNPALYGYNITDEPSAAQFSSLATTVQHLRTLDPAHVAFINLLPSYNTLQTLGASSYQQYLSQYMNTVHPGLLSYDLYPFRTNGDLPDYFRNLSLISHTAKEAGIPFMAIVQAASWDPTVLVPTADQLRFQAYTTLAYGAHGISYYVYAFENHQGGFASTDGTPTPLYYAAQSINADFMAIAKQVQSLTSIGAYHLGDLPPGWGTNDGSSPLRLPTDAPFHLSPGIPDTTYVSYAPVQGAVLGMFGPDDLLAHATRTLVVNLDYAHSLTTTVVGPANLSIFDPATGVWTPTGRAWATLNLLPGGGQLVGTLIPGDFNGDGQVSLADYAILTSHWMQTVQAYTNGDLNGDGLVNIVDFGAFKVDYNVQSLAGQAASVPEPGTWELLLIATVSMSWPRRARIRDKLRSFFKARPVTEPPLDN